MDIGKINNIKKTFPYVKNSEFLLKKKIWATNQLYKNKIVCSD